MVLKNDVFKLIFSCLLAGLLIKAPQWFGLIADGDGYYMKNVSNSIFMGLSVYISLSKSNIKRKQLVISLLIFILSTVYINFLPKHENSDSVTLAYLHLPLILWSLYGLIYIGFDTKDSLKRIDYLKYNGDLAIITAVILIAGAALSILTIGLFSAIDMNIENVYMDNIGIIGIISSPIVATYIIRNYPLVTNKIAPIIANIFSPLVLVMLVIFLIFIIPAGKDPYSDRDFLLVFNLMLLGVMAIIVFSVTGTSINKKQNISEWTLFILALITLIIDLVALSAILYRLGEYGFTPNRTAVLGSNILILGNLITITVNLYKVVIKKQEIKKVELAIAKYLPLYAIWALLVTFLFPILFRMR
jgi:hypothetical protein